MQKPRPNAGAGVVEAPAEVDGDAAGPQREPRRLDGAAGHQALEVERLLDVVRPHLDAEDPRERLGLLKRLQVLGGVHEQQVVERHRPRLRQAVVDEEPGLVERAEHLLAAQGVERDAPDVPLVARVVDDRQAARVQLVVRAAGGAGERAQRGAGHHAHCPTAAGRTRGARGPE